MYIFILGGMITIDNYDFFIVHPTILSSIFTVVKFHTTFVLFSFILHVWLISSSNKYSNLSIPVMLEEEKPKM